MAVERGPKILPSEWVRSEHPEIDPSKITRVRALFRGSNGELTTIRLAKSEAGIDISIAPGDVPLDAPAKPNVTFLGTIFESRPKLPSKEIVDQVAETTDYFIRRIHLQELDRWMRVKADIMGIRRTVETKVEANLPESVETHLPAKVRTKYRDYLTRLKDEEEKSGKPESACYGHANIGGVNAVVYVKNYDNFRGSNGQVAGEKFRKAAELARRRNFLDFLLGRHQCPLVCFLASSGARQDEGPAALFQLVKEVMAEDRFEEETNQAFITAFVGPVFGGESASIAPMGAIIMALEGFDYGFSGKKVIETYTKEPVDDAAQSVEAQALTREIDLVFKTKEEMAEYLENLLRILNPNHAKLTYENKPDFHPTEGGETKADAFKLEGFIAPDRVFLEERDGSSRQLPPDAPVEERLLRQYKILRSSAERPDMQSLIARMFPDPEDVVNLYQGHIEHTETYHPLDPNEANFHSETTVLRYPAIVASIAKLGPQPVMFIGNMPSYQRKPNSEKPGEFEIVKIPASPTPKDYGRVERYLDFAQRQNMPVVCLADTLGAKPTIEAERDGQPRYIQRGIRVINRYKPPRIAVITGYGGSGGVLPLLPVGDRVFMFAGGMLAVAEAGSQVSIIEKVVDPSDEQIKKHILAMKSTAAEQLELKVGYLNEVLPEFDDPNATAQALYDAIAREIIRLQKMSYKDRLKARREVWDNLGGIPIDNPTEGGQGLIKFVAQALIKLKNSK